jgi:7,8-dihydro-6-hydroxymethylpterin-pyrophosphokinase
VSRNATADERVDEQLARLKARLSEEQWEAWVAQVERSWRRVKSFHNATRRFDG